MISVKDVCKTYGKGDNLFTALYNVCAEIADGSTVAIIGKSGSGKSTLMHVMSGLDTVSSGEIVVNNKSLVGLKPKISLGYLISFFQPVRMKECLLR